MADSKVTGLTELAATPTTGDLLMIVDDPAGTPLSKKITVDNVSNFVAADTQTFTNKTIDANGTGNSITNIDVADLANGTDGELITWSAAAAPATVAVGTATHVLTSNGAGAAPTFQAAAGGGGTLVRLSSVFETLARFSESNTNGTNTFGINGNVQTTTGTTGSNASLTMAATGAGLFRYNPKFTGQYASSTTAGAAETFFGLTINLTVSGTGITYTSADQMGFKFIYGSGSLTAYSATNSDGSVETATDTGLAPGSYAGVSCLADCTTGVDIKFYVGGTLEATHTTNLPDDTASNMVMQASASNKSTASSYTARYAGFSVAVDVE